jgi:hypothetical protein
MGSRYGGLKQIDAMGPNGEAVIDYSVFDAIRAGFGKVVFIIRKDFDQAFRDFVDARFAKHIPVEYVYQQIDDLPAGYTVPEGREKPWGTGHATLAARTAVNEPFAVINADDFYGKDAYEKLAVFLTECAEKNSSDRYCMIGFQLNKTLSDFGSVSRGICTTNDANDLLSVKELTKISQTDTGAENLNDDGTKTPLTGNEPVSMNMWGFTPDCFDRVGEKFVSFLDAQGTEQKSEFYIPFVVDDLIQEGRATCALIPTSSDWFGVTYQEDKPHVQKSIQTLITKGDYPEKLWS